MTPAPPCPKCGEEDRRQIEAVARGWWFCNTCSHDWKATEK